MGVFGAATVTLPEPFKHKVALRTRRPPSHWQVHVSKGKWVEKDVINTKDIDAWLDAFQTATVPIRHQCDQMIACAAPPILHAFHTRRTGATRPW